MAKFEITWLEDRSDEAVLEEIRRVAALEPDRRRLTADRFDSVARIMERGHPESRHHRRFASLPDAAIIEDLKRVSESAQDEPFTIAYYSEHGQYSGSYIKRRFGGWREALAAASLHDLARLPSLELTSRRTLRSRRT